MPLTPKSISTPADELYELVLREGEIALKDAAQRLNVPIETVEAWAEFLQEDGLLALKYRMTTPYLTMPAKKAEKKLKAEETFLERVEEVETRTGIKTTLDDLKEADKKRIEGQFAPLDQIYNSLASKLQKITSYLASKSELSPQEKTGLLEEMENIKQKTANASMLRKANRFDEASRAYASVGSQMSALLSRSEAKYSEITSSPDQSEQDMKKLVTEIYALLEKGELEKAEKSYEQLTETFSRFSRKMLTEKSEIEDSIVNLNKDYTIYSNKINRERIRTAAGEINSLIAQANQELRKRNFDSAEEHYAQMRKLFEKLPPGFLKEKHRLKVGILKIFEQIAKEKESKMSAQFSSKAKTILQLLNEAQAAIKSGNTAEAIRVYKNTCRLYKQLPHGFMREKLKLHQRIIDVHSTLSQRFENESEKDMTTKTAAITGLAEQMKQALLQGKVAEAKALYTKASKMFGSLPKGFIKEKTEAEEKLVQAYENLVEAEDASGERAFTSETQAITALLSRAEQSIKGNNSKETQQLYEQIKNAYTKLTSVEPMQKAAIKVRILSLYRQILTEQQSRMTRAIPIQPTAAPSEGIHQKIQELRSISKAQVKIPT